MNKVRKKFVLYAFISLFVLLTVLLSVINVINFNMASDDADEITQMLARGNGDFGSEKSPAPRTNEKQFPRFREEEWGPSSPELNDSVRYFTFAFDKEGNAEKIAFRISAFTEQEAEELARKLLNESTGWTQTKYRYRVYKAQGSTFVTVIDQGRELLPCYRILWISVIGEAIGLALSFAFLVFISKKLFKPLEEADKKQRRFMTDAEREFKVPLTVIGADTELIERTSGQTDHTRSINRQVRKMTSLVKNLGQFALTDLETGKKQSCDVSEILLSETDRRKSDFEKNGVDLKTQIEDGISVNADPDVIRRTISEIVSNSVKYSEKHAEISLAKTDGRVVIVSSNGTSLDDGPYEAAFDRFTTFGNAEGKEGNGLGLAFVKEAVRECNGRITASVKDGAFTLKIII